MKKILKSLVILCVMLCVIFVGIERYRTVNKITQNPPVETFECGDEVVMGKDILINDSMEGYSIKVNSAQVLTYEEFLDKYNIEDEYTYVPEKVYDVEIVLKNINALSGIGVNLSEFYIQGKAVCASLDTNLYSSVNPSLNGILAIALRENTEITIHLPFALYQDNFRTDTWENLESYEMSLIVTLYPVKKRILLQETGML